MSGQCIGVGDPRGHWGKPTPRHRAPAAPPGLPALPRLRVLCPSTALAPLGQLTSAGPVPLPALPRQLVLKAALCLFFFPSKNVFLINFILEPKLKS